MNKEENYWGEKFNNLSIEHRKIGVAHELAVRIQQLKFEKRRIQHSYKKSIKIVNDNIKHCEIELTKIELNI